jgi:SAM-dependent methyltransferase
MSASEILPLYQRHAAAWAQARAEGAQHHEAHWLASFLELVPTGGRVLDLGCGSGDPIAQRLVRAGRRVTGVDGAAAMVDLFCANLPGEEALHADMRGLDLGRRFDGVLAWDSFFHLDHAAQGKMFEVFAKHAAPGAPLMFTSGPDHGIAMGEFQGEPLFHASLSPEAYRQNLETHGFALIDHVAEDPLAGRRTVWLARLS